MTFDTDGQPRTLDEQVEVALTRITQSLVSNVVRHADATRAQVTLTYQPESVSLDVVDNGQGFNYEEQRTRAAKLKGSAEGIEGVRTRVERLGGQLHVETEPGGGCGVSVSIPTAQAAEMTSTTKKDQR